MDAVREHIKRYFLEELRVDDGWREYIDMLTSHIDLLPLEYMLSEGFPTVMRLADYFPAFLGNDSAHTDWSGHFWTDHKLHGNGSYFQIIGVNVDTPPLAGINNALWDIGVEGQTYHLKPCKQSIEAVIGGVTQYIEADSCMFLAYDENEDYTVYDFPIEEWVKELDVYKPEGGYIRFFVGYYTYVSDDSGVEYSTTPLPTITRVLTEPAFYTTSAPTELNMALIRQERGLLGTDGLEVTHTPSPVSLFGYLHKVCVALQESGATESVYYPFDIVYFYNGAESNTNTSEVWDEYTDMNYAHVLGQTTNDGEDEYRAGTVGEPCNLITSEDVLVDAVRDKFGVSLTSAQSNTIYGYDKRLWVVESNATGVDLMIPTLVGYFIHFDVVSRSEVNSGGGTNAVVSVSVYTNVGRWSVAGATYGIVNEGAGGDILTPDANAGGAALASDRVVMQSPPSYNGDAHFGIKRVYADRALPANSTGVLTKIRVAFRGTEVPSTEIQEKVLAILAVNVPAGVGYDITLPTP